MKIEHVDFGFPLIIIDDYYEEEELNLIWQELHFLTKPNVLYKGSDYDSGSAVDSSGNPLKSNYSAFVDDIYLIREYSNILTLNRKIFDCWDSITSKNTHWFFKYFHCTMDFTLFSYYENNDYYDFHRDSAVLTSLTWFYQEPKKFEGGNLHFTNGNTIEVLNNRMVLFPSMIPHKVDSIFMEEKNLDKHLGRYCITQFLHSSSFNNK